MRNSECIFSDRGVEFTSNDIRNYIEVENIKNISVTTVIPIDNGQVDRVHKTLIPIISKLSNDGTRTGINLYQEFRE